VKKVANQPKAVHDFVDKKIEELKKYDNESRIRASLARLRRGIGKRPGSLPDIWELTLEGIPEELMPRTDKSDPTYVDWAVHVALTLFALHQQGRDPRDKSMSVDGKSLGGAVRTYGFINDLSEESVKHRFDAMVRSNSIEELATHLRSIVQLLRSEDIPLDYPQLAEDLYRFQFPESRDNVRLSWGRSYFMIRKDDKANEE
jgi:CRISPR system Cascade subunit CasB